VKAGASPERPEPTRTGLGVETLERAFLDNLFYLQARFPEVASRRDCYLALAYTVRDRLLERWIATARTYKAQGSRTVCYLSAEFLIGPQLGNNLMSLGILDRARRAMDRLQLSLDELLEHEEEPGLGNGGLGRLAACYLDSLATLQIPAIGYGIRYEFGIFQQAIRDGWQVERTDKWLRYGNPWQVCRPGIHFDVKLGGHTETWTDGEGRSRVRWHPARVVRGVAHDTPVAGHGVNTTNLLRLWSAEAPESFDVSAFNSGEYYRAVEQKVLSETLTKVLYPNDEPEAGKALRLEQQYFFVSCSLQDMLRLEQQRSSSLERFHEKFAVQLNDTHPAIAVAELMRLLVDEQLMDWERAWDVTRRTFAYTNHTLLPEALETWPVPLFQRTLPRHFEIVCEINRRFLDDVRLRFPGDDERARRLSLIDERGPRSIRMAHLATVGSFAVNGVAQLHTELLQRDVLRDFHEIMPEKFHNKTNGVTPRRFLALCNPRLARLLTDAVGQGWVLDMDRLRGLEPWVEDPAFRAAWREAKRANKADLARAVEARTGVRIDPQALLDVQVKRIHEYKRQHLALLHLVALYRRLKDEPSRSSVPRTVLFGGKAAPGYFMAKLVIKLINSVAEVVNRDPAMEGRLRVVFFPDYNVCSAQTILPAAELSEQISLAGKEASGTGNMKLAMNGALTIGTLDGANVELRQEVGAENFFLFGLTAEEVEARRRRGYRPRDLYEADPDLRQAIDLIAGGLFSHGDRELFRPLVDSLLDRDEYMLLADFASYGAAQAQVSATYGDPERWTRMSIRNVARSGKFSSDRAIREYCEEVWRVVPVPVDLTGARPDEHAEFRRAAEASARVSGCAEWVARHGS
jgi:starch phosphorylase